ncbi:hypothetical protein QZH56_30260 [Streptomyces olivoreticuli]|uniref:hypothetical protein n=1 Tax=Streptomyces olivoreticuli TaxID=68246 RepID=UPI002657EE5F|nr:hypothetical protein [Streptomyces olivoreticuli]WKK22988.1 hypothetical protein QZH56_30260 [Streptomyces olivoreticuli]
MILGSSTREQTVPEFTALVSRITPLHPQKPDLSLSVVFDGPVTTRLRFNPCTLDLARQFGLLMSPTFPEKWLSADLNLGSKEWKQGDIHGLIATSDRLGSCIGPYGRDGMAVEVWTASEYVLLPWVDFSGLGSGHAYSRYGGIDFGGRVRTDGPGREALVSRAGARDLQSVDLGLGAELLIGQAPVPCGVKLAVVEQTKSSS